MDKKGAIAHCTLCTYSIHRWIRRVAMYVLIIGETRHVLIEGLEIAAVVAEGLEGSSFARAHCGIERKTLRTYS
jgi:hypothetical protein